MNKLLGYLKEIVPYVIVIIIVLFIKMNIFLSLGIQIITGVITYLALSYIFKLQPFTYLLTYIKGTIKK